jgi:hypothetical protein
VGPTERLTHPGRPLLVHSSEARPPELAPMSLLFEEMTGSERMSLDSNGSFSPVACLIMVNSLFEATCHVCGGGSDTSCSTDSVR